MQDIRSLAQRLPVTVLGPSLIQVIESLLCDGWHLQSECHVNSVAQDLNLSAKVKKK